MYQLGEIVVVKDKMQSGLIWNEITLDQYLRDPEDFLEGTRMSFIGINKKEDRANLIAYLKEASRR